MDGDPHRQIERLEARIEELASRLESCRKLIFASRIGIAAGAIVLVALLVGAMRFDPAFMAGAAAAVLGGIVIYGSNTATAKEAAADLAAVEAERAALIDQMELRPVSDRPTLH